MSDEQNSVKIQYRLHYDRDFNYKTSREFYMAIFAGGEGSRFYKGVPKWLLPLANKQVIEWTIGMAQSAPQVLGKRYASCCVDLGTKIKGQNLRSAFQTELEFFIQNYNQLNEYERKQHVFDPFRKDFDIPPVIISYSNSKAACIKRIANKFYKKTRPYICALMGDSVYGLNTLEATLLDAQHKLITPADGALISILKCRNPKPARTVNYAPAAEYAHKKKRLLETLGEGLLTEISGKEKKLNESPAIFVFNMRAVRGLSLREGGLTSLCEALLENGKTVHVVKFDGSFYDFNYPEDYILAQEDITKDNGGPICR